MYIGSSARTVNPSEIIDQKEYTVSDSSDIIVNTIDYYRFYCNYTPGNVSLFVQGILVASSAYVADNGTDVRIEKATVTLASTAEIQIIGYNVPTSQMLERSDVSITGGNITGVEHVGSNFFMNKNSFAADITIPENTNAFFCGPVDFTGTINVNGVLNIL